MLIRKVSKNGEEVPASKLTNLTFSGKGFAWHRSLDQLKDFLKYNLKLEGKWTSPGGDVKLLVTSCDYIVKWNGRIKKKLSVVCDGHNQSLVKKLEKFATVFDDKSSTNSEVGQEENMADVEAEKSNSLLTFEADNNSQHTNNISGYKAEKNSTEFCVNSNNSCGSYCKDFSLQIKRIEDELRA